MAEIAARTGVVVTVDPDIPAGLRSRAVRAAPDALAAVRQAVADTGLAVDTGPDGRLTVVGEVVVTARRDEAETGLPIRHTSTSSRLGDSLREQPRNTQVFGARLLAEQQAQTIPDALRNAGGVSVNTATVQGGTGYSVRGFASGGVQNGLPGSTADGVAVGVTQSIANVERVEVLKGPDALLAGVGNLGGTINVVTKKPSAEPYLYVSGETGSYGRMRGTIDATRGLNDAGTISARVVATAASADRNFGGYRGNEDYLLAPSLRYKDERTDVVLSISASNQIFGLQPFVPLNPGANMPFDYPRDRPIVSRDQFLRVGTTQYYGEATREIGNWLTLVARAQHQDLRLDLKYYGVLFVASSSGVVGLTTGDARQTGAADALDGYARISVTTGPVEHVLVGGYTHVENDTRAFSASGSDLVFQNIFTDPVPAPLLPVDRQDYRLSSSQDGAYGQYWLTVGPVRLIAGVRHNRYDSSIVIPNHDSSPQSKSATTPNVGVVVDVSNDVSLFGAAAWGYVPTFSPDRSGNLLPDTHTLNLEGGVKVDLADDRLFLVASYFKLRQSNLIIVDPIDPRYSIAVPGQQGKGIDVNLTGQVAKGWQVQASLTRIDYSFPTPFRSGIVVQGQPRDQYGIYTSYRRALGMMASAGLGAGVYGRSSASVNRRGSYYVPAAVQADLNAFLTVGRLDLNLGVRNMFDRRNYGITYSPSFIPRQEPRNWRLTTGYRFQ
nr:TonB-dependent receptor [Sphingomonas jinjuensis]